MISISVVVTTHNLKTHLEGFFQSLMGQTFQDFDVIVVDDASTDETASIIKNWCQMNSDRFKAIYLSENIGIPGLVRNVAINSGLIDGEYVIFLDGDDAFADTFLERLYDAARPTSEEKDNDWADVVVCAYDRVEEITGRVISTEMKGFPNEIEFTPQSDMVAYINTAAWNKLWKREVVQDLEFANYRVGEEVIFSFRAYKKCKKITFIDDTLIHYAVRENSVISNTEETDIRRFAMSLKDEWNEEGIYKEVFELIIFIHIGLSMVLRAADNPDILIRKHINETAEWFKNEFDWFKDNDFLKMDNLKRHGIKGLMIWLAYHMYRMHIFGAALWLYRKIKLNIKF